MGLPLGAEALNWPESLWQMLLEALTESSKEEAAQTVLSMDKNLLRNRMEEIKTRRQRITAEPSSSPI